MKIPQLIDISQELSDKIANYWDILPYKDIIQFAQQDIDLSADISSDSNKISFVNYPYLIDVVKSCEIQKNKRKRVVFASISQMGKSTIEYISILHAMAYNQLQCIMVMPSLDLAVETAQVKFIPLLRQIPQFAEQINAPFAIRNDRVKLSNAILYWQGAGSKVVSKSAKLVLADQASIFQSVNNYDNLNELTKRTRSYRQCLQLYVSTPSTSDASFWQYFLRGSQGYYYLRCKHCGQLSMRSCDIHNLQFESIYNEDTKLYQVVRGTERLICPKCKYQHIQSDREWIVKNGGYLHKYTDRVDLTPSYQVGALGSLLSVHNWSNLADIQLQSGKQSTLVELQSFDNDIRGLPYQQRNYNKQDQTALSKHYYNPSELITDDIQAIYIVADTQDTFSVVGRFALTKQGNYYLIDVTRPRYLYLNDDERKIINAENKRNNKAPQITVLDMLNTDYHGIRPLYLLIDSRGHRTEEIRKFAKLQRNIVQYQGTSLKYDIWKFSEHITKCITADARKLQAQLIYLLYAQNNKQYNYLYLPKSLTDKDLAEIVACQPNNKIRMVISMRIGNFRMYTIVLTC